MRYRFTTCDHPDAMKKPLAANWPAFELVIPTDEGGTVTLHLGPLAFRALAKQIYEQANKIDGFTTPGTPQSASR